MDFQGQRDKIGGHRGLKQYWLTRFFVKWFKDNKCSLKQQQLGTKVFYFEGKKLEKHWCKRLCTSVVTCLTGRVTCSWSSELGSSVPWPALVRWRSSVGSSCGTVMMIKCKHWLSVWLLDHLTVQWSCQPTLSCHGAEAQHRKSIAQEPQLQFKLVFELLSIVCAVHFLVFN